MKTLGIIGGLGPDTTAEFYLNIIRGCQQKEKTRRPSILISSVLLSYTLEREAILNNKSLRQILPLLIVEAKRLEKAGADFLVMPCNSLHIFIENIRSSVDIPVLSIVEETIKFLKKKKLNEIGILSTGITAKHKLYAQAFSQNGVAYYVPDKSQQETINKIIYRLVNGRTEKSDREKLAAISDNLSKRGANALLLACTDLQLLNISHPNLQIFDTMQILADATIEEVLS